MSVVEREAYPMRPETPQHRAARPAVGVTPMVSTALSRLEASRAEIRSTMHSHAREIAAQDSAKSGPASLSQRLSNRLRRLPIVRTAIAIRSLRRG